MKYGCVNEKIKRCVGYVVTSHNNLVIPIEDIPKSRLHLDTFVKSLYFFFLL